jgi:hypothetical protein
MVRDLNPPLEPGIPLDTPARRRVDHRHCARLQPGTKAPVGSVPPDGVAVASSARSCAGSSPPAGAHSLRIAARQPCGHRLGSEVAPPVLPPCRTARLGPKTHTEARARQCRRRVSRLRLDARRLSQAPSSRQPSQSRSEASAQLRWAIGAPETWPNTMT